MGTTVYKLSRSYERHHQQSLASFDITDVSFSSIDQTPPLVVDAAEGLFFHSRFVIKVSCSNISLILQLQFLRRKIYCNGTFFRSSCSLVISR